MKTFIVGITGGIGSGKSYFSEQLEKNFIPVYNCDTRAKVLLNSHSSLKAEVIKEFGHESYDENGNYNVYHMFKTLFGDEKALAKVNKIVYKYIQEDLEGWLSEQSHRKVVGVESAIMFDTNLHMIMDLNIYIDADFQTRLKRIKSRDPKRTEEDIRVIIDKQMPNHKMMSYCDVTLDNSEEGADFSSYIKEVKKRASNRLGRRG